MPDEPAPLRPADPDDLRRDLAFALTHDGQRQFRDSSEMMARITAEHLARYLETAGYVVMKRPPIRDFAHIGRGPKGRPGAAMQPLYTARVRDVLAVLEGKGK